MLPPHEKTLKKLKCPIQMANAESLKNYKHLSFHALITGRLCGICIEKLNSFGLSY